MTWAADAPQGAESYKIKYEIVPYTRGRVLDLGSGPWKPYSHFISIDLRREWTEFNWKPDIVGDATDLSFFASGSFSSVFSSHLLEHIEDTGDTLREWWRVVKVGGYLVLYVPHKDFYPNIGSPGSNHNHIHDFMPDDLVGQMKLVGKGWDLVRNESRDQDDEYSIFQVYRKRSDREQNMLYLKKRPDKTCCVVRYGGIGDMIQASSILPGLKDQGYHVTFNCSPDGYDIIKHDPHIDDYIIQDKNQVPMEELGPYWAVMKEKFDKFINLTESTEVNAITVPTITPHKWPKALRHKRYNVNYLELLHDIAEVDLPVRQAFYATKDEQAWAKAEYRRLNADPVILYTLSGSAVHKVWPYQDQLMARILLVYPDAKIILVGDMISQFLQLGWENEPRIIMRSGEWSVRETLAFAHEVDLVIGPDTGVLNAVGLTDVPKIIFLSSVTVENITKYWNNTISLIPQGCDCYPCHQLNTNFSQCVQNEFTGTADCQAKISLDDAWEAVKDIIFTRTRKAVSNG